MQKKSNNHFVVNNNLIRVIYNFHNPNGRIFMTIEAVVKIDYMKNEVILTFYDEEGFAVDIHNNKEFYERLSQRFCKFNITHQVKETNAIYAALSEFDSKMLKYILSYKNHHMKMYNEPVPNINYEKDHTEKYYKGLKDFCSQRMGNNKNAALWRQLVSEFIKNNPALAAEEVTTDILIDAAYNLRNPGFTKESKEETNAIRLSPSSHIST